ncbi:hypothetical protein Sta7437_2061 [Stanieria cyanosphaera PCC 7437]|uniref:NifZ family protein n=1 Tax=Stanieria cyanosphaera (strain ATCC 29371 / PCC 7437) TaxID=111780 RepID=K9XSV8_STAC7|nr:hypothetical protein [Stanieria cyanosphaera]AFZ35613.1 hypothetical protein Sta7437_2061 [Stanieria cyanosphaera PCC 7437]
MFNIGDRVRHKATGEVGTVIGYGHQFVNDFYLTTIIVRLLNSTVTESVVEDLYTEWLGWQNDTPPKAERNLSNCLYAA